MFLNDRAVRPCVIAKTKDVIWSKDLRWNPKRHQHPFLWKGWQVGLANQAGLSWWVSCPCAPLEGQPGGGAGCGPWKPVLTLPRAAGVDLYWLFPCALGGWEPSRGVSLILTFLPFLPRIRSYHVGNLLQLVLPGWTAWGGPTAPGCQDAGLFQPWVQLLPFPHRLRTKLQGLWGPLCKHGQEGECRLLGLLSHCGHGPSGRPPLLRPAPPFAGAELATQTQPVLSHEY